MEVLMAQGLMAEMFDKKFLVWNFFFCNFKEKQNLHRILFCCRVLYISWTGGTTDPFSSSSSESSLGLFTDLFSSVLTSTGPFPSMFISAWLPVMILTASSTAAKTDTHTLKEALSAKGNLQPPRCCSTTIPITHCSPGNLTSILLSKTRAKAEPS
ncbi:hypothetical protein XENTR_v10010846 [Xenopus tropicalis]|nr:hypothetical protein XENTR_v10010846 [Xenopus tropicalis]